MKQLRLGAVGYLNARPLVYGLDRADRFVLRYDIPADCARLLHAGDIDLGLIPSIEYLRGGPYAIVPGLSIASRGPVASVAIYTTRPMADVRSIAMDASSRTSVALVSVLCARLFKIAPRLEARGPDLRDMLAHADAALIIGDNALMLDEAQLSAVSSQLSASLQPPATSHKSLGGFSQPPATSDPASALSLPPSGIVQPFALSPLPLIEKIDLGSAWTGMTGLPFVYAFWAGRPGALDAQDVEALTRARDAGVREADAIAQSYYPDSPARQAIGARYLRDNIKYHLGGDERAALEMFYRYAAEAGIVPEAGALRFF
ncbi:MAG: menaquinone biosynthesis protein [Acidobacteria bacterium]|nr:menaquinone biosynthesis protein [Acidobacteriota bacterium]